MDRQTLQSIDEEGTKNSRDFKTFWRRCLSVALQGCNASVISRKLARLGHSKVFTVDSSFARSQIMESAVWAKLECNSVVL